jgi:Rrf2 family protein
MSNGNFQKSDYAFRVLMTLIGHYGQEPISIRDLAQRNAVPKRFLEHIMLDLKSQGLVTSLTNKSGGYVLSRRPEEIRPGQVVRYFDDLLAPISCVSASQYEPCSQESICRFRRVFLDVRKTTARLMDNTTLVAAFAGSPVKQQEVFDDALMGGAGI